MAVASEVRAARGESTSRTVPANYAWAGRLPELVSSSTEALLNDLRRFVPDAGMAQVNAWRSSIEVLRQEGAQVLRLHAPSERHGTVLEYELPREAGRRPDVIVLQNGRVAVLEFKEADTSHSQRDVPAPLVAPSMRLDRHRATA